MSSGLLWLFLWTALLGWLAAALAAGPAAWWLQRRPAIELGERRRRLLLLAALPGAGVLAGIAVAVLPALLKWAGWLADHCQVHGAGHPHLCFAHLPALHVEHGQAGLLGMAGLAFVAAVLAYAIREGRLRRRMKTFLQLLNTDAPVATLASRRPLAFSAGLRKPRIVIADSLRAALTRRERHAVLRHEIAHVRAGDLWWNPVFEALLLLHWPGTARRLRRLWRRAMEEQADCHVVRQTGDALTLAEALLKITRLQSAFHPPMPASMLRADGVDAAARIRRLLDPVDYAPGRINWPAVALLILAAVLCLSPWLHHELETLLGHLMAWEPR